MRSPFLIFLLLLVGCIGTRGWPHVSSTPVPGTLYSIDLIGPNEQGHYMYGVTSSRGLHPPYRALGPLQQTSPVRVEKLRDGVYRIEWGDGPGAAFAIVNFTRSEFVEDSNPTNPKNVSFDRRDF